MRGRRRRARAFGHRRSSGARKERVLPTRISEQLSDEIRCFAEDLCVPASSLVRNVLEEVFGMVDEVSDAAEGESLCATDAGESSTSNESNESDSCMRDSEM